MKKLFLILMILTTSTLLSFAEPIAKVIKFDGKVTIFESGSPRGTDIVKAPADIQNKGKVATKRDSTALIRTENNDKIALDANSVVTLASGGNMVPEGGKVVFSITKRGQEKGMKVALATAVIGVKGTQFLVDMSEDGKCRVYLKEGSISVDAKEGEFAKHKAVVLDEYEAYIKKITGEYDKYIEDMQKQYTEYVKTFTMKAGQAISIEGMDVNDVSFDAEAEKAFSLLDE